MIQVCPMRLSWPAGLRSCGQVVWQKVVSLFSTVTTPWATGLMYRAASPRSPSWHTPPVCSATSYCKTASFEWADCLLCLPIYLSWRKVIKWYLWRNWKSKEPKTYHFQPEWEEDFFTKSYSKCLLSDIPSIPKKGNMEQHFGLSILTATLMSLRKASWERRRNSSHDCHSWAPKRRLADRSLVLGESFHH